MKAIAGSAVSVIAGVLVAGMLIALIEVIDSAIYLPPGIDRNNPQAMMAAMADMPFGALVLVIVAWAVGTFAGAWTAARLAGRAELAHGLALGVLFLVMGIADMASFPHPTWFWLAGTVVFIPAAYLGAALVKRRRTRATSSTTDG